MGPPAPVEALHMTSSERWFGFASVRVIPELSSELVMVPLVGHSERHTAASA